MDEFMNSKIKKYVHNSGKCIARLLDTSEYLGQKKSNYRIDYDLPIYLTIYYKLIVENT